MASQEFLASFAVDIDEAGVSRLQQVLEEDRALPLLRQLLGELSPGAREQLTGSAGSLSLSVPAAGSVSMPSVTQNNSNISAPVNIHVHASGMSAEAIGQGIYDTAERYLLRTLEGAMA